MDHEIVFVGLYWIGLVFKSHTHALLDFSILFHFVISRLDVLIKILYGVKVVWFVPRQTGLAKSTLHLLISQSIEILEQPLRHVCFFADNAY